MPTTNQTNEKCIREILKYVDENTGIEIDMENNISIKTIDFYTVVSGLSKDGKFKQEEVAYNTLLCRKFNFIECKFSQNGNTFTKGMCTIFDTTPNGEKFLNEN